MNISEMKSVAADSLSYFIHVMPNVPFTEDDVIIEFVPKMKMAEYARVLCKRYFLGKVISQAQELSEMVDANALIGRDKSAVICRINYKLSGQAWYRILFHQFMHIYCAKKEMDSEHFIDMYGSRTTLERPNVTPAEKTYDGLLVAGYTVWSEFIAQYYTLKYTDIKQYTVDQMSAYIKSLFNKVGRIDNKENKYALSYACARLLTCSDAKDIVTTLQESNDEMPAEQRAFLSCLFLLYDHMKNEEPWIIDEVFIADLGEKYIFFRVNHMLTRK